jgi:dihydrofolate reductase
MSKLRVHSFGMSIDGYGAGPNQSLENPLGVGGLALHEWVFNTRTFHTMVGNDGNALARAVEASEGKDIRLGGGVATIREYLRIGFVDQMHLAYAPALLGSGECLLAGMDLPALGYQLNAHIITANSIHVLMAKKNL